MEFVAHKNRRAMLLFETTAACTRFTSQYVREYVNSVSLCLRLQK